MSAFQVGQTVTGDYMGRAVTGTVMRVRPSLINRHVTVLDLDVQGEECAVLDRDAHLVTAPAASTGDVHSLFRPGQRVHAHHKFFGDVAGVIVSVAPSLWFVGRDIVEIDVDGSNLHVLDDACTLTEEPMTAPEPVSKPARKSSKKAAAVEVVEPVVPVVSEVPAASTPELPGTPTLLLPPGTLGLHAVPLAQTSRSTCNVRHHYDPDAIAELAASLRAEGQIENATGRWNADGTVEVVAGESRRRAQQLREDQGEPGLSLLVNIRELTDAEALSISATENMRRRNMTALEECEAMQRLNEAGKSIEEIQAMFGYKSAQPVADRILASRVLHTEARDLLDTGRLSLAQAFVIARAPGKDLQKQLVNSATSSYMPSSAADLAKALTRGQFLVKDAKFDVEASGLAVDRDLFGTYESFFKNKAAALDAQLAWANAQAKAKRAGKKKHPFVAVESGEGVAHGVLTRRYIYEYRDSPLAGLIYYVNTYDGTLTTETGYRLKSSDAQKAVGAGDATSAAVERPLPQPTFEEAHLHRARALRHALLGDTHRTLVLTVHAQLVHYGASYGRAALHNAEAWVPTVTTPEIEAKIASWQEALAPVMGSVPAMINRPGEIHYGEDGNLKLYDHLLTLNTAALLDLLNALIAARIYEPYTVTQYEREPASTFLRLAAEVNANAVLAQQFTLTDSWLKRYPKHELVKLAAEAGLDVTPIRDAKTNTEARALILEQAERLHAEGFVPAIVRFPDAPHADPVPS